MKLALITSLLLFSLANPVHAEGKGPQIGRWQGPCTGFALGETVTPAFALANPGIYRARLERLGICIFAAFAPQSFAAASVVISRESGWWSWATNPDDGSSCQWAGYGSCGLAQHLARYWPGRVASYLKRRWFPTEWPQVSVFDPRANLIVTAKMWQAEGGACPSWC